MSKNKVCGDCKGSGWLRVVREREVWSLALQMYKVSKVVVNGEQELCPRCKGLGVVRVADSATISSDPAGW